MFPEKSPKKFQVAFGDIQNFDLVGKDDQATLNLLIKGAQ
jgi:hypothetical protein